MISIWEWSRDHNKLHPYRLLVSLTHSDSPTSSYYYMCPRTTIYRLCVLILQTLGLDLVICRFDLVFFRVGNEDLHYPSPLVLHFTSSFHSFSSSPPSSRPWPRTIPSAYCVSITFTLCFTCFSDHTVSVWHPPDWWFYYDRIKKGEGQGIRMSRWNCDAHWIRWRLEFVYHETIKRDRRRTYFELGITREIA